MAFIVYFHKQYKNSKCCGGYCHAEGKNLLLSPTFSVNSVIFNKSYKASSTTVSYLMLLNIHITSVKKRLSDLKETKLKSSLVFFSF